MSDNSQALVQAKPSYARLALLHPLNLTLLGAAAAAVLLVHLWWVAILAGVGEVLWLSIAQSSGAVRRSFDRARKKDRQRQLFNTLDETSQRRALRLRELQRRIEAAAARAASGNDGFRVEVLRPEIDKLEDLIDGFLELAGAIARYDHLLRPRELAALDADLQKYAGLAAGQGEAAEAAQRNLQLLQQRKERFSEIQRRRDATRAEMDLVENTLKLLGDEVLGMRSAAELGDRIAELQRGVEVARQSARETERLFGAQLASGAAQR